MKLAKHSKCFAWTCLSISEYCWVMTLEKGLDMSSSHSWIHFRLMRSSSKDTIKRIPILTIVNHGIVMFYMRWITSRSETAEYTNILTILLFICAFETRIIISCWLYQWIWDFYSNFRDRSAERKSAIRWCGIFLWWVCGWGGKGWEGEIKLWFEHRYWYN